MVKTQCVDIQNQMNRIKGQVAGIDKMIGDGRDYLEILQQIKAVQSALSRLGVELLKDESKQCFSNASSKSKKTTEAQQIQKFEELVANFFKIA